MKVHHRFILIITAIVLSACSPVEAGWLSGSGDSERLARTETELQSQRSSTDQWQIVAGLFGVGCVLLFVIGTALGTRTRSRHASRS
jgi:hypothetical protein